MTAELKYQRAALRECIRYGEHGMDTIKINGKVVCFNCEHELSAEDILANQIEMEYWYE